MLFNEHSNEVNLKEPIINANKNNGESHEFLKISASWFWLILLTLASVFAGDIFTQAPLFLATVFFIVFLKGQQITDVFMELKHAPSLWRYLLLSYVIVVPAILFLIYV